MATWAENRDYILAQEAAGTLGAGGQNWLDWYRAAGSPATQEEFRAFTGDGGVAGRDYDDYAASLNPAPTPAPATGTQEDSITLFNPVTGQYDTISSSDYEAGFYRPGHGNAIWGTVGDNAGTLIRTDVEGWEDTGATKSVGDNYYDWTWGYEEPARETYIPGEGELALGGSVVYPGQEGETITGGGTTPPPVAVLPPTETPLPPDTNEPTDDWFWTDPVGYENAPQPDGDGEFVEGGPPVDTSWDWSFFRDRAPGERQWGGYDEDYQAFERYVPGMESPWGLPNVEGGNKDFYQQQFLNQLRDEQGYQNRERAAQMRRQEALNAEPQDISGEDMWSWAYGGQGLPDVTMGTGQSQPAGYDLNKAFQSGQATNADILRWAAGNESFGKDQRHWYSKHLANPDAQQGMDSTYWSSAGDPNTLIGNLPTDNTVLSRQNQRYMTDLFNTLYNPGAQGPMAPVNYASPVQWGSSYPGAATGG